MISMPCDTFQRFLIPFILVICSFQYQKHHFNNFWSKEFDTKACFKSLIWVVILELRQCTFPGDYFKVIESTNLLHKLLSLAVTVLFEGLFAQIFGGECDG